MSDNQETAIAVRRYGLLRPRDWGADCEAEMARMTALWNRLVGIERDNRADYMQATASPEVVAAQAEIDGLMARRAALVVERGERRKAAGKKVKTPDLDAAVKTLGEALHEAIERSRALRRAARDASRESLAILEERRKAAVKLARQQSGLFWSNYNAVCQSYERARQAVLKRGGELRERHGNADRITNQIQGGVTVAELMAGEHSQVRIDPCPDGERGYLMLTATVFTGRDADGGHRRRTVTWPVKLHRDFPADARIQEVAVIRERCAGTWRWSAVFTCRIPPAARGGCAEETKACGVDIGWRQMEDGLRVGVVASADGCEDITLPQPLTDRLLSYYELGSRRHQARHEMLLRLEMITWDRAPEPLRSRAIALLAERDDKGHLSASGLALRGLVAEWQHFLPDVCAEARDWADEDRQLWLSAAGRKRAMLARREHYRIVAKRIVDRFGVIGLEKIDWTQLASLAKEKLPLLARRHRVIASTHELLQAITSAAKREGARIHWHAGKSSFVCHRCGHDTAVNDRSVLRYSCGHCFAVHDQDKNAAMNLLAAARASAPVAVETPLPLAWQKRLAGKAKRRKAAETVGAAAAE